MSDGDAVDEADNADDYADLARVQGPLAWLNWRAEAMGMPARSDTGSGIVVRPLWSEYALYSDAHMTGDLELGPIKVMLAFPSDPHALGFARLELAARVTDHLLEGPADARVPDKAETHAYTGGNIEDEIASLLGLALQRRIRAGGTMRHALGDPLGSPFFNGRPPWLVPPAHRPMLPGIDSTVLLDDAKPLLEQYRQLAAPDAVAALRAAHQYADALWWADADPRISWIKLFGALEAAANRWDETESPDEVEQLRRRHPMLHGKLSKHATAGLRIVAEALSRTIGAENKLVSFVLAFQPSPPAVRPAFARVDWKDLEPTLRILYDHRSRDLHGGIPFPAPLCQPPIPDHDGVPVESFPALASSSGWTTWPAEVLPVHLHVFADLVGRTLQAWCEQLPPEEWADGPEGTTPPDRQQSRTNREPLDPGDTRSHLDARR